MINAQRILIAGISLLLFAGACTVQPLHSTGGGATNASANIAIEPVDTRLEQQVRNRLIFLLNGGQAEPVDARFTAKLTVNSRARGLLSVQRADSNSDTSARSLTATGTLVLSDTSDEEVAKKFVRSVSVSYEETTQFFANSRARIDAEDRAAAELAEELRNLVLVYVKSL